ncbi:MAG: M23 family metallopeptidase [Elusimicrobiota bacterium]
MSGRRPGLVALSAGLLSAAFALKAFGGGAAWVAPSHDWARFSVLTPAGPEEPDPAVFTRVKRLLYADHKVAKGEYSAWHLAKNYGTTAMSLQTTNNDELILLYPGKKVVVHNKEGLLYEVKKDSETLERIVSKFHRDPREAQKFRESVVLVNRLPGSALLGDYEFSRGARLLLPKISMSFDTYRFPFESAGAPRISSRFGARYHPVLKRRRMHDGLDLPKPWGTPVFPSRTGKVIEAGWNEGYGQVIVIRHSDGFTTRYGHLSKILVKVGQMVQRGKTMIGRVGSTGISTGPHLHFEVRNREGKAINPGAKIGRR